jgi:CMP-N-acetylneuraminic acid synthetase
MRILALITARGGSKRLPGKNTRMLGGKPLVVWSIDAAKDVSMICDLLISTDDPVIGEVCKNEGAFVPWMRPSNLATDTASSVEVAIHALDWYESARGVVDGLLLLQPTSPFRTRATIKRGIELFKNNQYKTVIGVSPTDAHPLWSLKIEKGYLAPFMENHGLGVRSQDLPPAYIVNGSFYLISPKTLRTFHSLLGGENIPLIIDSPKEALDIDTQWDFDIAEAIIGLKNVN